MRHLFAGLLLGPMVLVGCIAQQPGTDPWVYCAEGMRMSMEVTVPAPKVDVLLVVDNSKSMAEEQAELARTLPEFVEAILSPRGEGLAEPHVDLHIGVTSTDVGTGGYTIETCSNPMSGDNGQLLSRSCVLEEVELELPAYLEYPSGFWDFTTEVFAEISACLTTLGTRGCGFEQQLEAPYRSFGSDNTTEGDPNAGFLRDDSLLVVLWITDEDDCSVQDGSLFDSTRADLGCYCLRCFLHPEMLWPVQRYIERFRELRPEPGTLLLGFLTGVPTGPECEGRGDEIGGCLDHEKMNLQVDPEESHRLAFVCNADTGNAFPGVRYVEVAQAMGEDAVVGSICTTDFSPFLESMASTIVERVTPGVIREPLPFLERQDDSIVCETSCMLVEKLPAGIGCPVHMQCHEPDGPGTGCGFEVDESGMEHALCVVPQVAGLLDDRTRGCYDPWAPRVTPGVGWTYTPGKAGGGWIDWVRSEAVSPESEFTLHCCT